MASLGHVAVGLCAARLGVVPGRLGAGMAFFAALSLLPDLDVVAFALRVPYAAPFGHRGASHSICAALLFALLFAPLAAPLCGSFARALLLCAATLLSHGALDMLTDGGLGVAALWPLSPRRYFFPFRPLPVAPIGARLLSPWGRAVMATELLYFLPLWLYALWPRRAFSRGRGRQ